MQRIDSAGATASLPAPLAPVTTPGYFEHGNPATSTPYTVLTSDWANGVQEEIATVIEDAGITLDKSANDQLLTALQRLTYRKLSAPLTLYVATTGNDSHDGTIGSPFLTLQGAWNYLVRYINTNGYAVTINVADGTYTSGVYMGAMPAGLGTTVTWHGNPSTPANVIVSVTNSVCFAAASGVVASINGFKVAATGSTGNNGGGIISGNGAVVAINNINFGACRTQIIAGEGGLVQCDAGTYTISESADAHALAEYGGTILLNGSTVTQSGTPAFAAAFAEAILCGQIEALSVTFSGSATGVRYSANGNGVINTGGGGSTYLPGNSGGSTANGGEYI